MFRGPSSTRLVEEHGADARVRRLTTKSQFVALLYGQLSGASSLREIVTGLESHAARLYHLGAEPVRRSTLSDANAQRPGAVFAELLAPMMQAGPSRSAPQARRDDLSDRRHEPAAERAQRRLGALLGRGLRRQGACDLRSRRRSADLCRGQRGQGQRHHARPRQMPIEPGATYVFDLGYYDYAWWAKLDAAGCRIVTRFKSNTPLERGRKNCRCPRAAPSSPTASAFCPPARPGAGATRCRMPVREVRVTTDTGKVLRILSQRSRRPRPGDRRSLQAPLGHRAVLPLGQADPQDHPLPRHLRECRAHPDRRRADRLPAAAPRPGHAEQPSQARSPSPGSSAPISCTAGASTACSTPTASITPRPTSDEPQAYAKAKPDSRGTSPAMTKRRSYRLLFSAIPSSIGCSAGVSQRQPPLSVFRNAKDFSILSRSATGRFCLAARVRFRLPGLRIPTRLRCRLTQSGCTPQRSEKSSFRPQPFTQPC